MNFVLRKNAGVGSFLAFLYVLIWLLAFFSVFGQAKMAEAIVVEVCKSGDRYSYNTKKEKGKEYNVIEECDCGCFETETGSATHCKACSGGGGGGGGVCDGSCSPSCGYQQYCEASSCTCQDVSEPTPPSCGVNPKECQNGSIQGV